jgi:cytochrome subunit of sulfide dehydrogenase
MRALLPAVTALVTSLTSAPAFAQDTQARNLAAPCAICHGTEGRPVTTDITPLAGLPKEYLVRQMADFRDGKRPATVMQQLARGYSDAQIELIAAWFAARKAP